MSNSMPEKDSENQNIPKNETDKPLIVGRRRVVFEEADSNRDWGEPTTQETVTELRRLASKFAAPFIAEHNFDSRIFDEATLQQLTDLINSHFVFQDHGSGIGTLPKQLQHYQSCHPEGFGILSGEEKKKLSQGLDCKMATTMVGLTVQHIAQHYDIDLEAYIIASSKGSHPSLIVEQEKTDGSKENFLVDFRTIPQNDDEIASQQFESFIEEEMWIANHARSTGKVRPLTITPEEGIKRTGKVKLALDVNGLNHLDQSFLND